MVFTSALQLAAIAMVWLLAIIPMGLMALAVTLWKLASKRPSSAARARRTPRT